MPGLHNDRLWLSIPAIHTAPDQVLPVWSAESCESLELRAIAFERHASEIISDGGWQFDGYCTLKPDAYDADHSNRTYMQEKLTDFLRFWGDRFGCNNYLIVIEGSQKISFSGRK